jgi:hypothetical protein
VIRLGWFVSIDRAQVIAVVGVVGLAAASGVLPHWFCLAPEPRRRRQVLPRRRNGQRFPIQAGPCGTTCPDPWTDAS